MKNVFLIGDYNSRALDIIKFLSNNSQRESSKDAEFPSFYSGKILNNIKLWCLEIGKNLENWKILKDNLKEYYIFICIPYGERIDTIKHYQFLSKINEIFPFSTNHLNESQNSSIIGRANYLNLIITTLPDINGLKKGYEKSQFFGEIDNYAKTATLLYSSWFKCSQRNIDLSEIDKFKDIKIYYLCLHFSNLSKFPPWVKEYIKDQTRKFLQILHNPNSQLNI